jgi:hypothetical protein
MELIAAGGSLASAKENPNDLHVIEKTKEPLG